MKYNASVVATFLLAISPFSTNAFIPLKQNGHSHLVFLRSAVIDEMTQNDVESKMDSLTSDLISKLRFREVQRELERRALDASGTLSTMKNRLREATMDNKDPSATKNGDASRMIDADVMEEVRNKSLW